MTCLFVGEFNQQSLYKRPQSSRNPGAKYSEHFLSGRVSSTASALCRVKTACLLWCYKFGLLSSHGPIRQQLESMEVVQMEAQWVLRSQAVPETLARQLLQRKSFSHVRLFFPTEVELVWNFPRQYNYGVAY